MSYATFAWKSVISRKSLVRHRKRRLTSWYRLPSLWSSLLNALHVFTQQTLCIHETRLLNASRWTQFHVPLPLNRIYNQNEISCLAISCDSCRETCCQMSTCRLNMARFDSRRGLGIFFFTTASRMVLGPTQPPIQWVPAVLSLGVKRPGREANYSPPSSAEVTECVELYLHSPNTPSWRGAQLKHRDNFTL
jgi:hypothetical protein